MAIVKARILIEVEYDTNTSASDLEVALERELDRHIGDGLLLFDEQVEQYSAEVTCEDNRRDTMLKTFKTWEETRAKRVTPKMDARIRAVRESEETQENQLSKACSNES